MVDRDVTQTPQGGRPAGQEARLMVRRAYKGALATLAPGDGEAGQLNPHASLVQVAATFDGRPIILVSGLAVHTQNLMREARASLLIDESDAHGDPAAGARVSLSGRFEPDASGDVRSRYLARHPGAARFVDFGDFQFMTMAVAAAHYVAGFGRIATVAGRDVLVDWGGAADTTDDGAAGACKKIVDELVGRFPAVVMLDPDGLDIREDGLRRRLGFDDVATSVEDIRLKALELLTSGLSKP